MTFDSGDIGKRLRAARDAVQLSQAEAAEQVGVSRVVLSYYETGERQPPLAKLRELARIYGTTLQALLGAEEHAPSREHSEIIFRSAPGKLPGKARTEMARFASYLDEYVELLKELE